MKRKFAAFSLVEVMVAVFVLAVGILPTIFLFSRSNAGTVTNRDEVLAHQFVGELIDYSQTLRYDNVALNECSRVLVPHIEGSQELPERFKRYLSVIRKIPSGGISDWPLEYKIIQAEIEWTSSEVKHYFALTGIVFRGREE